MPRKKSHSLWRLGALTALAFSAAPSTLYAKTALDTPRWAISVNDGHSITLPNGKMATGSTYSPDSAVLIGFHGSQPFIGNGIELPGSVQGPPQWRGYPQTLIGLLSLAAPKPAVPQAHL